MKNNFKVIDVQFQDFLKVPKALLKKQEISLEAKIVYSLMMERMVGSINNNLIDEKGDVYIIYTIQEIMKELSFGKNKSVEIIKELEKLKLLEKKRMGLSQPNRIYLKKHNFLDF